MNVNPYVDPGVVLRKINSDLGINLDENKLNVIEWIGEVLEKIRDGVPLFKEQVYFGNVKDGKYTLHPHCAKIIAISVNSENVIYDSKNALTEETVCDYAFWKRGYVKKPWVVVRPTTTNYMGAIQCAEIKDMRGLYEASGYEFQYDPMSGNLQFNFKEGQIAMAALDRPVNKDGYPLIPDHPAVHDLCLEYVNHKFYDSRRYKSLSYNQPDSREYYVRYFRQLKNVKALRFSRDDQAIKRDAERAGYVLPLSFDTNYLDYGDYLFYHQPQSNTIGGRF